MANSIKGITIKLGADASELTTALRNADTALKSTQSNLREIDRALKLDPSNVTLLQQKQTELTNAIAQTKEKLEGFKSALQAMDDAGVEKTDADYMALERDILKAENQLESFNKQLQQTNAQASPLGQMSAQFQDIGNKCSTLGQNMAQVSMAAGAVVGAIGSVAVSTGIWADDLNTLSKVTGISTEKLQIYASAADLVDVEVGTIAKSVARLKKNMLTASEGTGAAAEAFDRLGVSVTDSNGNLRDQDEVFQEVLQALGQMSNETERDALAMSIFGKSAADLNPLIEDCGQTYADVAKIFEENGLGVIDQETLDKANAFNDSIDIMKMNLEQAKNILGAKLGEAFGDDVASLSDLIGKLSGKIADMNPNVLKVITIISGIIAVLAPVLIVIGAVISAVGTIGGLLTGLPAVIGTITGGISAAAGAVTAFLGPVGIAIAVVAAVAAGLIYAYNHFDKFREFVDKAKEKVIEFWQKVNEFASGIKEKIADMVTDVISKFTNLKEKVVDKAKSIFKGIKDAFSDIASIGKNIVEGIWNGISDKTKWIINKIKSFTNNVKDSLKSFFGIKSPSKWARDFVGYNIVAGMAQGISQNSSMVEDAMASLVPSSTPTISSISNEMINAVGTGMALANSGSGTSTATIVVNLGGAKVAEQIYKLNKQGAIALQG